MAFYETHDAIAKRALEICAEVREFGPLSVYRELARQCVQEPDRMAQVLMCLGAWVDVESPVSVLVARAESITSTRIQQKNASVAS